MHHTHMLSMSEPHAHVRPADNPTRFDIQLITTAPLSPILFPVFHSSFLVREDHGSWEASAHASNLTHPNVSKTKVGILHVILQSSTYSLPRHCNNKHRAVIHRDIKIQTTGKRTRYVQLLEFAKLADPLSCKS